MERSRKSTSCCATNRVVDFFSKCLCLRIRARSKVAYERELQKASQEVEIQEKFYESQPVLRRSHKFTPASVPRIPLSLRTVSPNDHRSSATPKKLQSL